MVRRVRAPHHRPLARLCFGLLAAAMVIGSCGTDAEEVGGPTTPSAPSTLALDTTTTTTAATTPAPEVSYPDVAEGTWVATAVGDGVEAWLERPPGIDAASTGAATSEASPVELPLADWWFPDPTQFDGPRVFLAHETDGEWLKVSLPIQPNGSTGWIRAEDVTLEEIFFRAEVDLANYQLTVWDGAEVVVQTTAAIGTPSTPTPLGDFFVRDIIPSRSSGSYGSYILGLSGFSETLETFNGGLPAIAIHGTNRPDLVGQQVSNGCIRIPNEFVELLAATVPLGTPVRVVG